MSDSFLEKSLNKSRWVVPQAPLDEIEKIARAHDVPEIVARILVQRGIGASEVAAFLNPTLKDHFPDPFTMAGMEGAAEYLAQAISAKRSIAIFGDFDVDGATSSVLLYRFLKACGLDAPIYIPDRLSEGYGPNIGALQTLKDQGAEIVIMLDCGTTAFDTVQAGRNMGLEIMIIDHHEAEDKLPAANHVINPKRKDDTSGLEMLAAVGVTFMVCVAVNNKLRAAGAFSGQNEPPLKDWLDIVALGTVCDMVPLIHVNRLLVRAGFARMQKTDNTGLKALINVSRVTGALTPYHAGFVLGPRINAGSRVHKADLGAKLLSTDDPEEAKNIAWTLNDCNDHRKDIQAEMERAAIEIVEARGLDRHAAIIVSLEDGHPGLSGLVAGRLKEKYKKPCCVVTYAPALDTGEREGRGSGRSVSGVHIAQAFIDARAEGLLEKGGGHAMAGGFTIAPDKLEEFAAFMQGHIARQLESQETTVETSVDALLSVRGCTPQIVNMIQNHIGPFGQEFDEPLFVLQNVRIHDAGVVGENHVRLMVGDWEGGSRMKAMAFRASDTPMGEALLKGGTRAFHLLGTLKIDNWSGQEKVEMHIKDAAFAQVQDQKLAV